MSVKSEVECPESDSKRLWKDGNARTQVSDFIFFKFWILLFIISINKKCVPADVNLCVRKYKRFNNSL